MHFISLEIEAVRNLGKVDVSASPGLNLLTGVNGSGKTSFIESMYFLSRSRSFRTRKISSVIQKGKENMLVAANIHSNSRPDNPIRVGMERSTGKTKIKFAGEEVKAISELLVKIPIVLIAPDGHELLEGSRKFRRKWIDMNVFHMKHEHLQNCREYNKALRNRNALLRNGNMDSREISAWEQKMVETGHLMTIAREEYLARIESESKKLLLEFALDGELSVLLKKGWKKGMDFAESLVKYRDRDSQMQYTGDGPHAADVKFLIDGTEASSYLSRGRQKILFTALAIATAKIMAREQEPPVILVDDLVADLDQHNAFTTLEILSAVACQTWVTATEIDDTCISGSWLDHRRFHVELGTISQA